MSLRILQVVGTSQGGRWFLDQVTGLRARGHEILAVTSGEGPLTDELRARGFRVEVVPFRGSRVQDQARVVSSVRALARLARDSKVDLVHAHGHKAGLVARLAHLSPGSPPLLTQVTGSVHLTDRRFRTLERLTIPFSDGVVASCEAFADDYRKLAAETPVWVNYYGLDPSPFAGSVPRLLREELGLSDSDVLVGMVAHMYPTQLRAFGAVGVKGHEVFIDAAGSVTRERPTVHFVVVGSEFIGDGSYEARLRSRARDAGIERLSFLGHRTDVPSILSSCDIVVVPSMSESASYAAIEAGLLRRPVIGSDVGGIPDTVVDGRSGILVPPGDSRALTRAVMALASDADLRARLGEEAHSRCLAKFDVTVTVQKLEEIYRDVVGRREAG